MTTWYVYAYDIYGARTYFIVSNLPKYAKEGRWGLEDYLTTVAAKKLGVSKKNVRLGTYSRESFDQGHLPSYVYQEGKWRSYTTQD
jgi:hypothetical protein